MANRKSIRWNRIAWKRVVPAGILILLLFYLFISLIVGLLKGGTGKNSSDFTICSLNGKQTLQAVKKEDRTHSVLVKDFNFYGESLNLYSEPYNRNDIASVSFEGDKFVLVDLCTDKKFEFEIGALIDSQINLGQLEAGFYSVYLKSGDQMNRVYLDRTLLSNNTIYTVSRNASRFKIELLANRTLFDNAKSSESVLDQPYLYLKVTEEPASSEVASNDYDIAISIAPALIRGGVSLVGEQNYGITEAKELWDVAEELKSKLEEAGLKVRICKDSYDVPFNDGGSYYGLNGVLDKAYSSKAKYFIYLDMGVWDGGTGTFYSHFAAGNLARTIHGKLMDIGLFSDSHLIRSAVDTGDYPELGKFDDEYEIREAGGIATGAGTYSDVSAANAPFAAENIFGLNTVKIVTNNIKSKGSTDTFKEKKAEIATAIYDGLMEYLGKK